MNWTPGPARCRSPEYEAEIAFTDMPGDYPIGGRRRLKGETQWIIETWSEEGRREINEVSSIDLMPPTITREALADELREMAPICWSDIVAHVIEAVKSGRVE